MNKTADLLYLFVMVLRCIWEFHNVYAKQQSRISVNFRGKYTSDIKNFEIVFPQRVNKDGNFISHLVQHHHSKRSTNEIQNVFYKIPIEGKDYLIELTPNRKLIAPGAVVEIRKNDVNKSSTRRDCFNENNANETLWKMFENLEIKKLKNTECHFLGHVKGENISKAALSTCYGLAGFIQIKQGFYTIEPVAGYEPYLEESYPHMLYKEDGLEDSSTCHTIREMAKALEEKVVRRRRESYIGLSAPMFAETLIVMDKSMINHHKDSDCENYVLTVFNMAFNLFRDASVGMLMTLSVVRIIRLEIDDDQMSLKMNDSAEKILRHFQTWQYEINPGDDTHPNHHDIALFLTRVNVCYSPTSRGILGLTTIGKACDPKQSAALCEDSGLRLGYVIAHEIGHLLGADHDLINSTGKETKANELKTVMHPHVSLASKTWSKRSQAYFKEFFKTAENCFLDEPEEHHFNVQDLLPGVMYNADFQCKYLFTINSRECDMGSTCTSLNCYIPGYACVVTHTPPADGTRCGESMWCHNAQCLIVGERPGAIDGNWGEWSAWSDCSRTCGSGVASSIRNCDKPQPAHGGKNCVGERKRYKICAATFPQNISDLIRLISEEVNVSFVGKPCETGRLSFRDIQCGEFNDWIYPEDGKIHSWKAHYLHEDNPCVLYCINEEKVVAALRPRVIDGTTCYRGIRDLCIAGNCKSLPCDLHFGSNAIEDACGVCHGDGTGCEFSQGVQTLQKLTKGLTKLVNIPVGTKNIKVEELSPTLAKIVVRDKYTKDIYVRGKSLGTFNVPGSQAWLGMIKKDQEALHIPGPVSKPLSIWIHRLDNVTVKWSMALPAEQQRKPEFAWDFLKWEPCSAICGPGIQKSDPSCMEEKAGLVEDSFCADLQMPATKVRPCEVAKCIPRWMVGDWKYCEKPNPQRKEKKRLVYCIKKIGEGEGETQIVPDSECKGPKPHSVESCENRKKREDLGYSYLEEESMYKSDTSDYAFRNKYDDYLKHFAALSVPQKKSETIPLHLVSSPHFRHYFHVLETPEDSDINLMEADDININSIDNKTDQILNKVLFNFYKNTFSGYPVHVGHLINKLSTKKWKSVHADNSKNTKRTRQLSEKVMFEKKDKKRREGDKKIILSKSNFYHRKPNLLLPRKKLCLSDKKILNKSKLNELWKTYSMAYRNKKNLFPEVKTPQHKPKNYFKKKINWNSNYYLPQIGRQKMRKRDFFSKNFKFNSATFKEGKHKLANAKGSGKSHFLIPKETVKNFSHDDFKKVLNFKKRPRSEDKFFGKINSKIYFKNCPKTENKKLYPIFKYREINKTKRSNRKRKKSKVKDIHPKSTKDCSGNACGVETRNFLSNLFRENRKKVTTHKPQESVTSELYKTPVIQAGKVVIDRDSVEDKQMEILFLEEDTEEKSEKINQLPRPPVNGKKLSLKGQDVFNLIQTLQRRSCLYRQKNDTEEKSKVEIDVKIPVNFSNEKKPVTDSETTKVTTNNIATANSLVRNETTSTTIKHEEPNISTENLIISTTKNQKESNTPVENQAISTTKKQKELSSPSEALTVVTTQKYTESTEKVQSKLTVKSESTSKNTTEEEIGIENSDSDQQYDIDEIITYPPSEETTTEEWKKKKKKKKKKYKGPLLEDYEEEIEETKEESMTKKEPILKPYNIESEDNKHFIKQ